jgi:hypothetical protein
MPGLGRNEDHAAGTDRLDAFRCFDRALAFHDEVEVLADFVEVVRRGDTWLVPHDAREHVVDLRQFLVDEERALASRDDGHEPRQLILMKDVSHEIQPIGTSVVSGFPSTTLGAGSRTRHGSA